VEKKAKAVWTEACHRLKEVLSEDIFDRWIAVIQAKTLEKGILVLRVENDFYQTWLEENYLSYIKDAVTSVAGSDLTIEFVVSRNDPVVRRREDTSGTTSGTDVPKTRFPSRNEHTQIKLNPNYSFDSFIIGSSNNFAHAASLAVAQSPARAYNPLFIYGGVGLGKTHLMQAIGNYVLRSYKARIAYMSCEAFTNEYIDAIQNKSLFRFRKKYRQADLLLIDDIQFLAGKERMQEEFFHTFNALFDQHKQIVLTCDRPASEIPGIENRLVSRFEWGLVTELEPPDVETRIAILRNKQKLLKLDIPGEVIEFLAERIRTNIRRLEGALIRVASYGSLTGRDLTGETLEYLLRDTLDQEMNNSVTIECIQRGVADFFDIRLADMTSKRRPQSIAFPRQIAMYLCRVMTSHSYPMIADAFGRNHATVLHAHRLVEQKMDQDVQFRQTIMLIRQRLEQRR